jgi:hypothetical protein
MHGSLNANFQCRGKGGGPRVEEKFAKTVNYRKPFPRQKTTKNPSFQTMGKNILKHNGYGTYFLDILNTGTLCKNPNGSKKIGNE